MKHENKMTENEEKWNENRTPKLGISDVMQRALDWWHELPVQNLQDMADSWVGHLWKYYPDATHPYHLTGEEVQHIYESEHGA